MSSNSVGPLVYLIACEPSGDQLGAALMNALREESAGAVRFAGVGGPLMKAAGLQSLFDIRALALLGIFEVLPKTFLVLDRVKKTVADIEATAPDILVTIDSWGFTGRVHQRLARKKSPIPRVRYVAPQVWAWRPGRAKQLARWIHHLMALLPFEPPYFQKHGLATTWVGHPVLEGGFNLIATLPADTFLAERLAQLQPDMIIVDAESDARDSLEHVVMATRDARRPIVLFTNDDDTSHVKDAVAAGVSAYIVAGLEPTRIRPILDVAMARFEHEQGLRRELADAKDELQDRKTIARAKTMLMQRQGLSESLAYDKLRKAAMDKGLRMGEVAQRLLDAADLLG